MAFEILLDLVHDLLILARVFCFSLFQTQAAQAAFVFASQCFQRRRTQFHLATPTPLQSNFTSERFTTFRALL
jgi:hypothetical protein